MEKRLFSFLLAALLAALCSAAAVSAESPSEKAQLFRIAVENKRGGAVVVSRFPGTWETVGRVLYPCQKVNEDAYTASKWAQAGAVAATAVNAIHIKTGVNPVNGKGVVFSLVPFDMTNPPEYYNSFLSPDSSIYTDIPAGERIFGGEWAPFVGNPVSYTEGSSEPERLPANYVPKLGHTIVISVERPQSYPRAIIFENKFGGRIYIDYTGSDQRVIGEVLKPVQGIGRFQGTQFSDSGRIRANHTGVIDVSTSPLGKVGGFQIIPSGHGMSSEMINARVLTQWMVIGPTSVFGRSLEGQPPFFSAYLRPRYKPMDLSSKQWYKDLQRRFLVDVKMNGSDWQPMPRLYLDGDLRKQLPDWASTALKNVTHVRILFPVEE